MEEYRCAPSVRRKCPDSDGPECTYSPGGKCEADNMAYLPPTMRQALAEYRATGLTPEEVEKLKAEVDFARLKEIWGETPAKVEFRVPLDRLQELLQAEEDGRLVVLPCKVGDTVYRVFHPKGCKPAMGEHKVRTIGDAALLAGHMGEGFLVDNYLTRQEAVAAVERLKGEGEHG